MRRPLLLLFLSLLCSLANAQAQAHAQAQAPKDKSHEDLRDPSSWPAALRSSANPVGTDADSTAASGPQIKQIVVRHGKPFVVAQGREWGVGAKLGNATIVRIEEQAVWLRDTSGTRREALYPGIEKKSASEATHNKPRPPSGKPKKSRPEHSAPLQETP